MALTESGSAAWFSIPRVPAEPDARESSCSELLEASSASAMGERQMLPLQTKMTRFSVFIFLLRDCPREVSCDILLYPVAGEQDRFYSTGGKEWERSREGPWW